MNDSKVLCDTCLEQFNLQDTFPKNGGRICQTCEAITMTDGLQDEKELKFDEG